MYILLTLFFISLAGIVLMVGRKLVMLQNGHMVQVGESMLEIPYIKKVKHVTIKNMKIAGHAGLVGTIRLYVRSSNFAKNRYHEIKNNIKSIRSKNQNGISEDKKEVSKFLKMISEYKHKIREIKHRIHEEEKNL